MNVPFILLILLLILMIIIGGKRGFRSFLTLIFNFLIMFILLILIAAGIDPIKVTIIGCILISIITLFYINGINVKTVSSLIAVMLVVFFTALITYKMGSNAKIQGFSSEEIESIAYLSFYINVDFSKVVTSQILLGLISAVIDVSISISSSMYELSKQNSSVTKKSLIKSGLNIGRDILGTMTNTLLFAYIGSFMTLIIYFTEIHSSFADILNSKVFCSEVFQSLCGGVGIILIIPVTAFIMSEFLFLKLPKINILGAKAENKKQSKE
ncbi:YibE/F family protein [Clostridium hydrogenum]|uniref:YibE/F family protein n=1 Tax=Clostridium hydrogenum TaxID=2855764 RepID=UPI001F332959|nr:YibE/F family protein [Clostridium hydrogenum]